jgi:hypothetical protein
MEEDKSLEIVSFLTDFSLRLQEFSNFYKLKKESKSILQLQNLDLKVDILERDLHQLESSL